MIYVYIYLPIHDHEIEILSAITGTVNLYIYGFTEILSVDL